MSPLWLTICHPIVLLASGNEQEVAAMEIGGNHRANAIFEASCVYTSIKPTSRSDHSSRMAFVQEKYMSRSFYDGSHYSFCAQRESSYPLKTYHQYEPLTPKGSKSLLSYEDLFKPSGYKEKEEEEEEEEEDFFGEAPYNGSLMDGDKPQGNDSSTAPTFSLEDDDDGDMFADSKTTTSELFGPSCEYQQQLELTKPIEGGLLCFLEKEEKHFGVINFAETTSPKKLKTKPKAKIGGTPFGEEKCFSTRSPKKKGRPKVKMENEEWTQFAPFGGETQVHEKIEQKKPNYENNSRWCKKLSDYSDRKDRRSEVRNALHSWLTSDDKEPEMVFHTPKQDPPKQRKSWTSSPAARSAPNISKRRNSTDNDSRRSGIKSVPSSPKCPLTPEVDAFGFEVAEHTKKIALASALEPHQIDGFGFSVPSLSVPCSPSLRSRKSIQTDPGQKIDHFSVTANIGAPNSAQATKRVFTRQPSLQNFLLQGIPPPFTGSVGMKTGETVPPRASSRRSASRRDAEDPLQDTSFLSTESSDPDSIGIQTGEPAPRRASRRHSSRRESGSGSSLNDSCGSIISADTAEDMPVHGKIPQTSSPHRRGATDRRPLETPPLTPSRRGRARPSPTRRSPQGADDLAGSGTQTPEPRLAPSPTRRSPSQGVDDLAESGTQTPEPRRRRSKSRHDRSGYRRSERSPRLKLEDAPPTPSRRRARTSALKLPLITL